VLQRLAILMMEHKNKFQHKTPKAIVTPSFIIPYYVYYYLLGDEKLLYHKFLG